MTAMIYGAARRSRPCYAAEMTAVDLVCHSRTRNYVEWARGDELLEDCVRIV